MALAAQCLDSSASVISLADLETELNKTLVRFEELAEAWPKAERPLDRARIGKAHDAALERIGTLRNQIARLPARGLQDVAVKLRRLLVVAEGPEAESLLTTALDGLEATQAP